jgi:hypothetical protein
MRLIQKNGHWIVALMGAVSLAYSAGLMHDRLPVPALGVTQARETPTAQAPPEAEALSSGFRHAAKAALPAMVSIEVRGKVAQAQNGQGADPEDLFENSPFGEMFKRACVLHAICAASLVVRVWTCATQCHARQRTEQPGVSSQRKICLPH